MVSGLFCCCGVFINGKDGGKRERLSSLILTDILSGNRVSRKVFTRTVGSSGPSAVLPGGAVLLRCSGYPGALHQAVKVVAAGIPFWCECFPESSIVQWSSGLWPVFLPVRLFPQISSFLPPGPAGIRHPCHNKSG